MVKQGDSVNINGKVLSVVSVWGQGRHTAFQMSDGAQILDLDKLIASGRATVVTEPAPSRTWLPRSLPKEIEKLAKNDEDFEE